MRTVPLLIAVVACVAALTIAFVAGWRAFPALALVPTPEPPGTVVQSQRVDLSGEAMHSQWRAFASRKYLGSESGNKFYQWYLSIYAWGDACASRCALKYQSPADGGPLSIVEQPEGSKIWFPMQQLRIVGAGEFMQPAVQELVVQSHEMSADCGASTVTVFMATAAGKVVPAVSARNGCDLSASISHGKNGDAISLSGPYYGPNAPMCCPTKPHATAMLNYKGGKWIETPNYYPLYAAKFPPN